MKIYNKDKTVELDENSIDLKKGYLIESTMTIEKSEPRSYIENGILKTEIVSESSESEPILIYIPFTEKELKEQEISALEFWFVDTYRVLFEKYIRKATLGLKLTDGSDPQAKLNELYLEAEVKASQLHDLRLEYENL